MEGKRAYLTLKEASERLGVHPNTLRNWERRGLVRLARLPGSRYRRVSRYEVERLRVELVEAKSETAQHGAEPTLLSNTESAPVQAASRSAQSRPLAAPFWSARLELPPPVDPERDAQAEVLLTEIKTAAARLADETRLEELMQDLRGHPWSS
jgi:excisionase family DNA binding protein